MPRLFALLVAGAAVAGCALTDCGPFPAPRPFAGAEVRLASAPAPDTLVVAFVREADDQVWTPDVRPAASAGAALRMELAGDERQPLDAPLQFEAAARNDTVFVRRMLPLLRAACSPAAAGLDLHVTRAEVPAGVRHVRVVLVDPAAVGLPAAAPPAERRPAAPVTV